MDVGGIMVVAYPSIAYPSIEIAVKDGATPPYIDVFVETSNFYAGIAQNILDIYELCDETCTIVMQGTPLYLFGVVDLTQYFADVGITSDLKLWRVVEESFTISGGGGIISTYRLANPEIDLSNPDAAAYVATLTSDQMWEAKR